MKLISFGIVFTFFQKRFHLISLDETIYFMNSVPVKFDIFSMGPDGEAGTDDDIGNWNEDEQ